MAIKAATTAKAAFAKYGYAQAPDGVWLQARGPESYDLAKAERWLEVEGGWLCFKPNRPGIMADDGGAFAWPVAWFGPNEEPRIIVGVKDGAPTFAPAEPKSLIGLLQIPWRQGDAYAGVSGLHPAAHPHAFAWVWPDDAVAEIYHYAGEDVLKVQDYDADGVPAGYHYEEAPKK